MELTAPDREPIELALPQVMGVVNVTPDSFSDGGALADTDAAVRHGLALAQQGAAIVDVGGESTRPGAERTPADEQHRRVVEVIRRLRRALDVQHPRVWISIDTTRAAVAEAALDAGATMVNDISAGRDDSAMLPLTARRGAPIVLMHMQGEPATMQRDPRYGDVVAQVRACLLERAAAAERAGVRRERIVIDPGIGFGKTTGHNLQLLARLNELVATGRPVLLGASRKGFIRQVAGETTTRPDDRVGGTCATTALAVAAGVRLVRVHDVQPNLQAARVAAAITAGRA